MPTLLVVDEDPRPLRSIGQVVASYLPECRLITANNPEEGLRLATGSPLDGALVAVQAIAPNDVETCKHFRTDPATSRIPLVLILPRDSDPERRGRYLEAGADDFLFTPLDRVALVAKIRSMLRLKAAEDELRHTKEHLQDLVAKRIEALDRLAAGAAHDFNNLLTAVLGNVELAKEALGGSDEAVESLDAIEQAAIEAKRVAQTLLGLAERPPTDERRPGGGRLVLLAQNNRFVRETAAMMLETLGYRVIQAVDGDDLMEGYRRYKDEVDLIVADVDLPKQNGPACLQSLRTQGATTPAVLVADSENPDWHGDSLSDVALLHKPFRMSQLADAVAELLGGRA